MREETIDQLGHVENNAVTLHGYGKLEADDYRAITVLTNIMADILYGGLDADDVLDYLEDGGYRVPPKGKEW
jgi:hypothetical protein